MIARRRAAAQSPDPLSYFATPAAGTAPPGAPSVEDLLRRNLTPQPSPAARLSARLRQDYARPEPVVPDYAPIRGFSYVAPILGLTVLLSALDSMPAVWAQTAIDFPVHPPVEIPAALTMIPYLGDVLLQVQKWIPVVFQVVGAFSMIAAMTANETDDKVVNYILKAINVLGFNFGTAKNDPTVGISKTTIDQ